ncbi:MAG: undecaprenyl-phosphate glucose phosphotransferase [Acidobacteria bacterium]|nr:undecaprenyl-phosphate glucose phosphotransferase [Acidobacteriota bacterium]
MLEVRSFLINTYLAVCDLAVAAADYLLLVALINRGMVYPSSLLSAHDILPLGWILGVWLASLVHCGMYRSRRLASVFADFWVLTRVCLVSLVVLEGLTRLIPTLEPRPHFLLELTCMNFVVLGFLRLGVRFVLRFLRRRGYNIKNLVIIAAPDIGDRLSRKFEQRANFGYRIIRRFDHRQSTPLAEGLLQEICALFDSQHIDDVILGLPANAHAVTGLIVKECESRGINVRVVPDLFPIVQSDTQVYDFDGLPLVNVRTYPPDRLAYSVLKRMLDIVLSILVLVVLSPVYALIALAIKITSAGPVLFSQERVGLNGRRFKMYKFRTMRPDPTLEHGAHWTTPNSPFVTPLGRWLRRSNLDELPQFWNVLLGNMSVVGPRPERPCFLNRFRQQIPQYMLRQYVKCGITGWAQVNGWRGDTSIPERVEHDLYYIRHWALALDIKILLLTLTRTFFHRNAY